jgi:hypothetical protein
MKVLRITAITQDEGVFVDCWTLSDEWWLSVVDGRLRLHGENSSESAKQARKGRIGRKR